MIFEQTLTTFSRRFLFCRVIEWNKKEKVITVFNEGIVECENVLVDPK